MKKANVVIRSICKTHFRNKPSDSRFSYSYGCVELTENAASDWSCSPVNFVSETATVARIGGRLRMVSMQRKLADPETEHARRNAEVANRPLVVPENPQILDAGLSSLPVSPRPLNPWSDSGTKVETSFVRDLPHHQLL